MAEQLLVEEIVTGIADPQGGDEGAAVDEVGDIINYQIVPNNGGTQALSGVRVSDRLVTIGSPSGDANADGPLDVTGTWTDTEYYTAARTDLNTALDNRYSPESPFFGLVVEPAGQPRRTTQQALGVAHIFEFVSFGGMS
jgi:hypothetical protein